MKLIKPTKRWITSRHRDFFRLPRNGSTWNAKTAVLPLVADGGTSEASYLGERLKCCNDPNGSLDDEWIDENPSVDWRNFLKPMAYHGIIMGLCLSGDVCQQYSASSSWNHGKYHISLYFCAIWWSFAATAFGRSPTAVCLVSPPKKTPEMGWLEDNQVFQDNQIEFTQEKAARCKYQVLIIPYQYSILLSHKNLQTSHILLFHTISPTINHIMSLNYPIWSQLFHHIPISIPYYPHILSQIPSGKLTVCDWTWPFIVSFPIKNGDFP